MSNFVIELLLIAVVFHVILPKIAGASFNGSFWTALVWALVFTFILSLVELAIAFAALAFGLATLGFGFIPVIFAFLLGFWLIPAIALKTMANLFPSVFTFQTWRAAILAGLCILAVEMMVGESNPLAESVSDYSQPPVYYWHVEPGDAI